MAIKVVVVDGDQLPRDVEFPPLETDRYGWEQYLALSQEEIAERCWRADIVVSLAAPIERSSLQKMHKLKLLIAAGKACGCIDLDAAREQGVEVLGFPDIGCSGHDEAQALCNSIVGAIDHYIRNFNEPGTAS
jgi:lactate dehydrogenase-like 2-hydroxyacid dehydrogenase